MTVLGLTVTTDEFTRPLVISQARGPQEAAYLGIVCGMLTLSGSLALYTRTRSSHKSAILFAWLQVGVLFSTLFYGGLYLFSRANAPHHQPIDVDAQGAAIRASILLGSAILSLFAICAGCSAASRLELSSRYNPF